MAENRRWRVSKFFEEIAPGGKYFKYSKVVLICLGFILVVLTTSLVLPLVTGRYQNPLSDRILKHSGSTPAPKGVPLPTYCPNPNYEIPGGHQEYTWSHGPEVTGPKIQTTAIDPQDPKPGQKQTLTITVKTDSPVTSAQATLLTDTTEQTVNFKLKNGSSTDGTWELSWSTKDTYKCRYGITFELKSDTGNFKETMHIR